MAGQSLKVNLILSLEIVNLLREGLSCSGEPIEDIPQKYMYLASIQDNLERKGLCLKTFLSLCFRNFRIV